MLNEFFPDGLFGIGRPGSELRQAVYDIAHQVKTVETVDRRLFLEELDRREAEVVRSLESAAPPAARETFRAAKGLVSPERAIAIAAHPALAARWRGMIEKRYQVEEALPRRV